MKKSIYAKFIQCSIFISIFLIGLVVGQNLDVLTNLDNSAIDAAQTITDKFNNETKPVPSEIIISSTIKNEEATNIIVADNNINNNNQINESINNPDIKTEVDTTSKNYSQDILNEPIIISNTLKRDINLTDITNKSGLTADEFNMIIDTILIEKNKPLSKLKGQGEVLVYIENEYNVNGLFALSVASFETGYGLTGMSSQNNLYGISKSGGGYQTYESPADSIIAFGKLIRTYYFDKGYTNIRSISGRYCASAAHWNKNVTWFMHSLYAITANKLIS